MPTSSGTAVLRLQHTKCGGRECTGVECAAAARTMADYEGDPFAGKKIRCAVNGFGRVGRIVARIAFKSDILE